jgi:hypothetical protein
LDIQPGGLDAYTDDIWEKLLKTNTSFKDNRENPLSEGTWLDSKRFCRRWEAELKRDQLVVEKGPRLGSYISFESIRSVSKQQRCGYGTTFDDTLARFQAEVTVIQVQAETVLNMIPHKRFPNGIG